MSSMFKKKGGPAFKPRAPIARPRHVASNPPPAPASKPTEAQAATPSQTPAQDSSETTTPFAPPSGNAQKELPDPQPRQYKTPPSAPGPSTSANVDTVGDKSHQEVTVDEARTAPTVPAAPAPTIGADVVIPSREEEGHTPEVTPIATSSLATPIDSGVTSTVDSTPAPKPRGKKRVAASTAASGADSSEAGPTVTNKRQTKSSQSSESAPKAPRKRKPKEKAGEGSQPRKKRARSLTPEDAESQVVDLQTLTMGDLTKDLHIGKKFSRHDELRDRERLARVKARLKQGSEQPVDDEPAKSGTPAADQTGAGTPSVPPAGSPALPPATAASSGPQLRIVDGQIVIDQSSLVIDRHARAAAAQAGQDMETVEENDFTRLITSNSFMNTSKLKGPNVWSDSDTELFYRALRMFGTDFEIISKMFPGKSRRHIKLKFNREERHSPRRVDAALIGEKTIKIDIDEYKTFTGSEFEPVENIEAEHRKIEEKFEADRKRIADEQEEAMRKKKEALFADDEDGNEEHSGKKKKKGGRKKGKETIRYGLNGEPIQADS